MCLDSSEIIKYKNLWSERERDKQAGNINSPGVVSGMVCDSIQCYFLFRVFAIINQTVCGHSHYCRLHTSEKQGDKNQSASKIINKRVMFHVVSSSEAAMSHFIGIIKNDLR